VSNGSHSLELPAFYAYTEGMSGIQYTVRGVPEQLDAELRREARATGRSLNALVVETLEQAKLRSGAVHEDLDWFIGSAPRGSVKEQEAAQAWLDSLPAELA
jgi:hypothetical protein